MPITKLKIEEWDETSHINLRGTFLTIKLAMPYLTERGGSVIFTSSVNGTRMFQQCGRKSAYATTKAAQVAFAKMLALELGPQHIRVNAICPGAIETEIDENTEDRTPESLGLKVEFPEGKIPLTGKHPAPQIKSRAGATLASDAARHITGTETLLMERSRFFKDRKALLRKSSSGPSGPDSTVAEAIVVPLGRRRSTPQQVAAPVSARPEPKSLTALFSLAEAAPPWQ